MVTVTVDQERQRFSPSLGRGEIEAMQLALKTKQSLLIMDDRLARRQAMQCGLDHIGTARMLLVAEQRSVINDAATVIQRMAAGGYRISPRILHQLKA